MTRAFPSRARPQSPLNSCSKVLTLPSLPSPGFYYDYPQLICLPLGTSRKLANWTIFGDDSYEHPLYLHHVAQLDVKQTVLRDGAVGAKFQDRVHADVVWQSQHADGAARRRPDATAAGVSSSLKSKARAASLVCLDISSAESSASF